MYGVSVALAAFFVYSLYSVYPALVCFFSSCRTNDNGLITRAIFAKKWAMFGMLCFVLPVSYAKEACKTSPNMYFFGDSLTDSGYQNNNPDVMRVHKTPQWTSPNGHVWAYYFMQNVCAHSKYCHCTVAPNNQDAAFLFSPVPRYINPVLKGNNFAAGGSTTGSQGIINTANYKSPSLLQQIDYYLNHSRVQKKQKRHLPIYLIWSGSNDVIKKLVIEVEVATWLKKLHVYGLVRAFHIFDLRAMQPHFMATERQIAHNVRLAVDQLQQAGAKRIVVLLLPDVSVSPLMENLVRTFSKDELTQQQLKQQVHAVIMQTNALISTSLQERDNVLLVDVNQVLSVIAATAVPGYFTEKPRLFGRSKRFYVYDTAHPACSDEKALTCIPDVPEAKYYVFEDLLHPTDQTHRILGDFVYFQLHKKAVL